MRTDEKFMLISVRVNVATWRNLITLSARDKNAGRLSILQAAIAPHLMFVAGKFSRGGKVEKLNDSRDTRSRLGNQKPSNVTSETLILRLEKSFEAFFPSPVDMRRTCLHFF